MSNEATLEIPLPLGDAAAGPTFDLEKAVCSHGLFMMSPNHWDPQSRTFSRPLRLLPTRHCLRSSPSVLVSVYQPPGLPHALLVRVHGTRSLSLEHRDSLLRQVGRMLRLSDADERVAREFRKMVGAAVEWTSGFGGRVFRSPTLFEDMVKCILLCNCQWSRTLNMARALCELQLELHCQSSNEAQVFDAANGCKNCVESEIVGDLAPKTPARKDYKRKRRTATRVSVNLTRKFMETETSSEPISDAPDDKCQRCRLLKISEDLNDSRSVGNFPSPAELANLDEGFLAKRCNLGYRASRIIKIAKGILEGRIPLEVFEEVSDGGCLAKYDQLAEQLRGIEGFGPFTCANVLMCMGFYHVIPTDSETLRHLKQVHAKVSTIQTVQKDIEEIYGKYAPFQFLAYWAELWHFYGQRFGKLSELPCSGYPLITASNMRMDKSHQRKRKMAS